MTRIGKTGVVWLLGIVPIYSSLYAKDFTEQVKWENQRRWWAKKLTVIRWS